LLQRQRLAKIHLNPFKSVRSFFGGAVIAVARTLLRVNLEAQFRLLEAQDFQFAVQAREFRAGELADFVFDGGVARFHRLSFLHQ